MEDHFDPVEGRNAGAYRLRFAGPVEAQYRRAAIRQRRVPVLALFLTLGFCFALAPLYEVSLFAVSPELVDWLRVLEFLIVAPAMFAAAAATWFDSRPALTRTAQSLGIMIIWAAPLTLRHFALEGRMHYPSGMIGVVIVAIAIFGRFNWYRIALGSIAVLMFAGFQEYRLGRDASAIGPQLNLFALMALIAVLGSYVNEVAFRLAWFNGHSAALLARTDVLTGLSNRVEFNRIFTKIFQQARRERRLLAVAVMDLDHFKSINDAHGHMAGDDVLKALGKGLLHDIGRRPLDLMVRYGGEEVVVVWYDVAADVLHGLVESVLTVARNIRIEMPDGAPPPRITASIGLSWLVPGTDVKPEQVLQHADQLMYRAKAQGRDQAVIAEYARD